MMQKILVINNDADTMSLLKSWLEKKSYKVKYTSNGGEVPNLMKNFAPDLVLADVLQKEAVIEIKSNKKTSKVPVILMTGYSLMQGPVEVAVEDAIEKPFNLEILSRKIEKLITFPRERSA